MWDDMSVLLGEARIQLFNVVGVIVNAVRDFLVVADKVGNLVQEGLDGFVPFTGQTESRELRLERGCTHTRLCTTFVMVT